MDKVKPGYGTTNDGNTVRRFFRNSEISYQVTNIDINLIKKCHMILRILSGGKKINTVKFGVLLDEIFIVGIIYQAVYIRFLCMVVR